MKKITFLIYLSLMFSSVSLDFYSLEKNNNKNYINVNNKYNLKKSLKAPLYSLFIPGAGQYFVNNDKYKGALFLGLEIIALAGYNHFLKKADNYKIEYQAYGNNHWNFITWCNNYYDWESPSNEFFYVFANNESGVYPGISEDSHHIDFTYNDNGIIRYVSSSSSAFEELYINENLENEESAQDFYNNNDVVIRRDHNFYENISKYNHFFAGWDDHDAIYTYDNNGYIVATSDNKAIYRSIYDKSVQNYRTKNNFVKFIFINHFASMLDALIVSKISSNRTAMLINYNPRIDFYQAQLSVKLD